MHQLNFVFLFKIWYLTHPKSKIWMCKFRKIHFWNLKSKHNKYKISCCSMIDKAASAQFYRHNKNIDHGTC